MRVPSAARDAIAGEPSLRGFPAMRVPTAARDAIAGEPSLRGFPAIMAARMDRRRVSGGNGSELLLTLLLCGMLAWIPLPFASITRAGQVVVQVAAFTILALGILTARSLEPLRAVAIPGSAVAAVGLLGLLQSLPWGSA